MPMKVESERSTKILDTKRTNQTINSVSNTFDSQALENSVNYNSFQINLNQSTECDSSAPKVVLSKRTMRSR